MLPLRLIQKFFQDLYLSLSVTICGKGNRTSKPHKKGFDFEYFELLSHIAECYCSNALGTCFCSAAFEPCLAIDDATHSSGASGSLVALLPAPPNVARRRKSKSSAHFRLTRKSSNLSQATSSHRGPPTRHLETLESDCCRLLEVRSESAKQGELSGMTCLCLLPNPCPANANLLT